MDNNCGEITDEDAAIKVYDIAQSMLKVVIDDSAYRT